MIMSEHYSLHTVWMVSHSDTVCTVCGKALAAATLRQKMGIKRHLGVGKSVGKEGLGVRVADHGHSHSVS